MPKINDKNESNEDKGSKEDNLVVIGIGASAGGLEALRAMISGLPVKDNITYVIAQHLDPKHSSMLANILEQDTDIPVIELTNKQELEPATIYMIPPGMDGFIIGNEVQLESATGIGPKPSVDRFFASLAEEKAEKAVGVILSGTGSDGAHGMRAIKAEGGITIAQEEATAKFPSMPHASIVTGHVDLILAPEKIGKYLPELIQFPRVIPEIEAKAMDHLSQIYRLLLNQTGGDFHDYKTATINRRIERRMSVHRLHNVDDYITLLESNPEELHELHQDILITVTSFFRDSNAFDALNKNIKRIVDNAEDEIRIWVAACATGEEAYSVAILLSEHLGQRINDVRIQIFATDLDEKALTIARQGFFPKAAIESIPPDLLNKYFSQHNDAWQSKAALRDMILFAKHDLVKAPPFSHLDLITCRNVLIYFNTNLQERVLQTFHYALEPKGLLFLGKSETTGAADRLFSAVDRKQRLYEKRGDVNAHLPSMTAVSSTKLHMQNSSKKRNVQKKSPNDILDNMLAGVFQPDCVLLNQHLEVTYVRGDVTPFLALAEGRIELNACDLVRNEYRHDLRGLLYKAKREEKAVYSRTFRMVIHDTHYKVRFVARHFNESANANKTLLIFEKTPIEEQAITTLSSSDESNQHVQALQQELRETKESLQTTIEELETSNEELQSTFEEAQSTNEELYTSTEELQTSNEELQSTNEELRTVNQEVTIKTSEIELANDRLLLLNQQLEEEIDERKQAEKALSLQKEKLRTIIDSEPAWVNVCDSQGVIVEVNPAGVAIMEADSMDDLVGKELTDFVKADFLNEILSCKDDLTLGETRRHSIEVATLKGNMRWLEVSTVLLPENEFEDIKIMSIICDQTQYKLAQDELITRQEELSHAMRLNTLGAMASGLAHELNQPLSAITNYINGCERRVRDNQCERDEVLEALSLASLQAQRAGDIINHVKHFIQKNDFEGDPIDLNKSIHTAVDLSHATGQSGSVKFTLELSDDLPRIMISDIQIEQVLLNLIRNGVESMQEAEIDAPEIIIRSDYNKDEDLIWVSVTDQGKGLNKELQKNIFKPFHTTKSDGMGMGLCISRSIIETYAGHFTVDNQDKGGAIFSFSLPVNVDQS